MNNKIKKAIIKASDIYKIDSKEVIEYIENMELREVNELRFSPYFNLINMLTEPENWYIKTLMSTTNEGTYSKEMTRKLDLPKYQIIYGSEFGIFGIPIFQHKEYGFISKYHFYRVLRYSYFNQCIVFISRLLRNNILHVTKFL